MSLVKLCVCVSVFDNLVSGWRSGSIVRGCRQWVRDLHLELHVGPRSVMTRASQLYTLFAILIYCWVVDSSCVNSKDLLDSDSLDFHTSNCFLFSFLYVGPTGALVRAFAAFLFYSHIHANWLTRFTIDNLQTSWTKELSNKQTSRQIEKMLKLHNQ